MRRLPRRRARPLTEAPGEARIHALEAELARERFAHSATMGMYRRALDAQEGVLTGDEYRKILACLHPDRVADETMKKLYTEAFAIFGQCEILVRKKDRHLPPPKMPTREEWAAMRRAATEKRKAARRSKSRRSKSSPTETQKISDRRDPARDAAEAGSAPAAAGASAQTTH
jgi:hypothetical protein